MREMRNSWWAWSIGLVWTILSAYSTLSSFYPRLAAYVHVWPWYVYVIGFLGIALIAVCEAAYRQARILWQFTDGNQINERALRLSESLGSARVYRQELWFDLLTVCAGTSIGKNATVFAQVKTWAKSDLNITKLATSIVIDDERYEAEPIEDLSEWILVEDVVDDNNRKNHKNTNLERLSLVKEMEDGVFREGHHQPKWVGYELPLAYIADEQIKGVKMVFHDKHGVLRSETFRTWPKTSHRVIDAEFRRAL